MNESGNPTERRDQAHLTALLNELISHWRELARSRFDAEPPADGRTFEQCWPRTLDNFFLAETIRVARIFRMLSEGREN